MIRVVEQSHEEKVAMYMKLKKKELIEMLIESNRLLLQSKVKISGLWLECDVCKCKPSNVTITQFGTFCQEHVKY